LENVNIFDFAILSFASIFVIVDPIATVPAFLAMTEKHTCAEKIHMAKISAAVTCLILLAFFLGGHWILRAFGVTLPAFEIGGGIVLLKIAIDMLQAKRSAIKETPEEQSEGIDKADIAVTPLAVPMLAGPGAITAVILLNSQTPSLTYGLIAVGNIFFVSFLTFLIFYIAATRSRIFSGITMKIITRLLGLLLAAIAAQFVLNGIRDAGKLW